MKGMLMEFWSNIENVKRTPAEDIQSDILVYLSRIKELAGRVETAERQREEAVQALEEMVDEMGYLKSQFNTGDVAGLGIFADADALVDKAGDIIINIRGYKNSKS